MLPASPSPLTLRWDKVIKSGPSKFFKGCLEYLVPDIPGEEISPGKRLAQRLS